RTLNAPRQLNRLSTRQLTGTGRAVFSGLIRRGRWGNTAPDTHAGAEEHTMADRDRDNQGDGMSGSSGSGSKSNYSGSPSNKESGSSSDGFGKKGGSDEGRTFELTRRRE